MASEQNNEELQSTDANGNVPSRRVTNANQAYSIYTRLREDDKPRAVQRVLIKGQQDGNPPFSRSKKVSKTQAWQANVNFRRAKATVTLHVNTLWQMFRNVETYINLSLRSAKADKPTNDDTDYGSIIAHHFSLMLNDWKEFDYHLQTRLLEMDTYGNGPVLWENEHTWKSKSFKNANLLLPDNAKSCMSDVPVQILVDEMEVSELWQKIEDEDAAEQMGWNVMEVKRSIHAAFTNGQDGVQRAEFNTSEWESLQERVATATYNSNREFDRVRIVKMLVMERTGKVSQLWLADNLTDKSGQNQKREFMLENYEQYPSMDEAVNWLLWDIGDGYVKSVRGLAYHLYPTDDIFNRTTCEIINSTTLAGGILLQPKNGASATHGPLVKKSSGVTEISSDYTAVQQSFAPNVDKHLRTVDMMLGIQNSNWGVFSTVQPVPKQSRSGERTAKEVELEAISEARTQSTQAAWYYSQWEKWLMVTFRRALNKDYPEWVDGYEEAKAFRQRCIDDGVPAELLDFEKWTLKAVRAVGMGSMSLGVAQTDWLMSVLPLLDERARANVIADAIQVRLGPDKVDRYYTRQNPDVFKSNQHSIADMENNDFAAGQSVTPGSDQPISIHGTSHLGRGQELAQAYIKSPNSINILETIRFFRMMLPHMAQHIQNASRDKTRAGDIKMFERAMAAQSQVFKKMQREAQELLKQQEAQQQEIAQRLKNAEDMEVEMKHRERMREIELKGKADMAAVEGLNAKRMAQLKTQIETTQTKTAAEIQRKNTLAIEEIKRENMDAAAKIHRENREFQAQMAKELAAIRGTLANR